MKKLITCLKTKPWGVVASVLMAGVCRAEDIDLTAQIRSVYEADPTSVLYSDGGDYASGGISPYTPFDGITTARWLGNGNSTNYLQIELPKEFNGGALPAVRRVVLTGLNSEARAPKHVRMMTSNDGVCWVQCGSNSSLEYTKGTASFDLVAPHIGRLLRLELLENAGDTSNYRYNINEVYFYGDFERPTISVCQGRDGDGHVSAAWEYPFRGNTALTLVPNANMTTGASSFSCIGYTLETSTDGGQTWVTTMSDETSVTLPADSSQYRVTWRWTESVADGKTVVYVSPDGDGSDGTSWAKAYKTIDSLVLTDDTFVKIAGGTYTVDNGLDLTGRSRVTLSGGWNPMSDTCDPLSSRTVLTTSAGHAGVVLSLSSVTDLRCAGLRFVDCVNDTTVSAAKGSAANLNASSSVTFEDCVFRNGIAQSRADKSVASARGGAVFVEASSGIFFDSCDFNGNRAQSFPANGGDESSQSYQARGGAVSLVNSVTSFRACRFVANQVVSVAYGAAGGAVHAQVDSAASHRDKKSVFNDCVFVGNLFNNRRTEAFLTRAGVTLRNSSEYVATSYEGAGSALAGYCLHVYGSTFAANRATAIYYESTASAMQGRGTVRDCRFCDQPKKYYYYDVTEVVEVLGCQEITRDKVEVLFPGSDLYVSPSGSDSASGTAVSPLKTVAAALAKAEDGTTVHLASGTYSTGETFPLECRGRSFVNLIGEAGVVLDADASDRVLNIVDSAYVTVGQLTVTGGRAVSANGLGGGVLVLASRGTRFEGVTITGNSATTETSSSGRFDGGGLCVVSGDVTLEDSTVALNRLGTAGYAENARGFGISALTSSLLLNRCRVSSNSCVGSYSNSHHAYGAGVYFGNVTGSGDRLQAANTVIDGNVIGSGYYSSGVADRHHGLAVCSGGDNVFVNCTFVSNRTENAALPKNGQALLCDAGIVVTNCLSIGHTSDFPANASGTGNAYFTVSEGAESVGTAIVDPLFKSGTFIPSKNSPLVDAGVDVGWTKKDSDFSGGRRLYGVAVDIGAAEYSLCNGVVLIFR